MTAYQPQEWVSGDKSKPLNGERLTHIESGIKTNSDDIEQVTTKVSTVEASVENVKTEISAVKTDLESAKTSISSNNDTYNSKLEAVTNDINQLKEAQKNMENKAPMQGAPAGDHKNALEKFFNLRSRYFSPVTYVWADHYEGDNSKWKKYLGYPNVVGIVIINPKSGPGDDKNEDFVKQIKIARNAAATPVGYVLTGYGSRDKDEIMANIAKHMEWYNPSGVFLDEAVNGWGDQKSKVAGYIELYKEIKSKYGEDFLVVANPGSNTVPEMLQAADVLMSFENSADQYLKDDKDYLVTPDHYRTEPGYRFWHVIHDVKSEDQARKVLEKAQKSNVSHVFLTDDHFSSDDPSTNPYDQVPSNWLLNLQTDWAWYNMKPTSVYSYSTNV